MKSQANVHSIIVYVQKSTVEIFWIKKPSSKKNLNASRFYCVYHKNKPAAGHQKHASSATSKAVNAHLKQKIDYIRYQVSRQVYTFMYPCIKKKKVKKVPARKKREQTPTKNKRKYK